MFRKLPNTGRGSASGSGAAAAPKWIAPVANSTMLCDAYQPPTPPRSQRAPPVAVKKTYVPSAKNQRFYENLDEKIMSMEIFYEEDYTDRKKLSIGAFGYAASARETKTNHTVVLKKLWKSMLDRLEITEFICSLIECHATYCHKNVLALYDLFLSVEHIYLFQEYCPKGSLYDWMNRLPKRRVDESTAARYIRSVASTMIYLDTFKPYLIPEKLMLGNDGELKMVEIGWSVRSERRRPEGQPKDNKRSTLDYMPPETLDEDDLTVDPWSVGVLCYEMLSGRLPFQTPLADFDEDRIRHKMLTAKYSRLPTCVSEEAEDFIAQLLVVDPEERLCLEDMLVHSWILKNAA